MTCAGWLFIRVSASLGVFFSRFLYSHIQSYSTRMIWISPWSWIANPYGVPLAFIDFCATRVFTYRICPHTLDLKHTYSAAARVCLYRLVCSRVYSLSTLNLFIVCSSVQFYPIVVSAWTKVTCAFFYCRISVPLGTWTRTTQIKSLVLYHWASGTYGGSLFRRDNQYPR